MPLRSRDISHLTLDPGIQPLVAALNREGFITGGSCQGGKPNHLYPTAFITLPADSIKSPEDREQVKDVVRQHTTTPFRILPFTRHKSYWTIDFDGPINVKQTGPQDRILTQAREGRLSPEATQMKLRRLWKDNRNPERHLSTWWRRYYER